MTLQEFYSDESKWCKGSLWTTEGARCLVGAVYHCYPFGTAGYSAVITALTQHCGAYSVMCFNDAPRTTFADVRRVIEKANV